MTYGQQPGHGRSQGPGHVPSSYGHQGQGGGYPRPPYGRPPQHGQQHGQPGQYAPPGQYPPPGQHGPPGQYAPQPQYPPPQHHAPPHTPVDTPRKQRRTRTPAGGPVTDDDERWAVPAYVGMFVAGFLAPAIVYVAKGRTSDFARFHAIQALNLFVAMFACTFTVLLLTYLNGPDWLPLVFAVLAADCFAVTKAAIGANRCEWNRLPALVAWRIFH